MEKIYESPMNSWDETAEGLIVYALEEGEHGEIINKLDEMPVDQFLAEMGYADQDNGPGAVFHRFSLEHLTMHHLIIGHFAGIDM